jgi:hypothetical protein
VLDADRDVGVRVRRAIAHHHGPRSDVSQSLVAVRSDDRDKGADPQGQILVDDPQDVPDRGAGQADRFAPIADDLDPNRSLAGSPASAERLESDVVDPENEEDDEDADDRGNRVGQVGVDVG